MRKRKHLARHDLLKSMDARNTVADADHRSDLFDRDGLFVVRDLFAKYLADFISLNVCHACSVRRTQTAPSKAPAQKFSLIIPLSASPAFRPNDAAVNRRKPCLQCAPQLHPEACCPPRTSPRSSYRSFFRATDPRLSSARHSTPRPISLPPRPLPAARESRFETTPQAPGSSASAGDQSRETENCARFCLHRAAPKVFLRPRAFPCRSRQGLPGSSAIPRIPRMLPRIRSVASAPVPPRPVAAPRPPVHSHIGGSLTSIRPPFQRRDKSAHQRFLRLRGQLFCQQRFRAVHCQLRGNGLQFHPSCAFRRFNFCLSRH